MYELLAHLLGHLRGHGNLVDADTSGNETLHGRGKRMYANINKQLASFTVQMLRAEQALTCVLEEHEADTTANAQHSASLPTKRTKLTASHVQHDSAVSSARVRGDRQSVSELFKEDKGRLSGLCEVRAAESGSTVAVVNSRHFEATFE